MIGVYSFFIPIYFNRIKNGLIARYGSKYSGTSSDFKNSLGYILESDINHSLSISRLFLVLLMTIYI
jgi:hypothetical protein